MATPPPSPQLQHRPEKPLLAGVCLWLGRRLRVDPLVVRIAFVAGAALGGAAIALYAVLCLIMPREDAHRIRGLRSAVGLDGGQVLGPRTTRGAVEVALGAGLLTLAALLTLRATGLWVGDALVWPLALVVAGGALIWRTSVSDPPPAVPPAPARPRAAAHPKPEEAADLVRERAGWAAAAMSRTGVGAALVVAAALVFLQTTGALTAARDVALAAVVVAIALAVIFAPWIARLVRSLDTERAERIRSQERAEVAAHLHDSVLQTLALVQKRAGDPVQVAALARRQERELRQWLSGRRPAAGEARRLLAALEAIAGEIEAAHGASVEVVTVGDTALDERGEALVAAAREAMLNAARHGGGSVSVYAEASDGRATVFIRDRGPGFDPSAVPPDRRGISESIVGRMARHGGHATIHARPGEGTEVELSL